MMKEAFLRTKAAELRGFAKEYANYAKTMPTDPFATRWHIIAEALRYHADGMELEAMTLEMQR